MRFWLLMLIIQKIIVVIIVPAGDRLMIDLRSPAHMYIPCRLRLAGEFLFPCALRSTPWPWTTANMAEVITACFHETILIQILCVGKKKREINNNTRTKRVTWGKRREIGKNQIEDE